VQDKKRLKQFLLWLVLSVNMGQVTAVDFTADVGIESLGFFHNPLDGQQHNHYLSGSVEAEIYHEWDNGAQSIAFVPFYRYSQHDSRRTHFDIRELSWL
jgi:hypothetical protein